MQSVFHFGIKYLELITVAKDKLFRVTLQKYSVVDC